jgi:hypothetical protein
MRVGFQLLRDWRDYMKKCFIQLKISVKKLLQWRLEKAMVEVPMRPSAMRLLALVTLVENIPGTVRIGDSAAEFHSNGSCLSDIETSHPLRPRSRAAGHG